MNGGGPRRQRGIDADPLEQVAVAGPTYASDDLGDTQLLGQQRHQQVLAVVVGHGDHHIGVLDALLLQKLQIGSISSENQRFW